MDRAAPAAVTAQDLHSRMTGPQRVSDADRERVVDVLRLRCAEGYLSLDTLSGRVEAAYRAKTSAQLEAVILGGCAPGRATRGRAPRRR